MGALGPALQHPPLQPSRMPVCKRELTSPIAGSEESAFLFGLIPIWALLLREHPSIPTPIFLKGGEDRG